MKNVTFNDLVRVSNNVYNARWNDVPLTDAIALHCRDELLSSMDMTVVEYNKLPFEERVNKLTLIYVELVFNMLES